MVLSGDAKFHVAASRAEDFCDSLPASSVHLIAVDHPYFNVKSGEAWDTAWASADAFIDWTRGMLRRYQRILAPNGSLYVFASPGLGREVENAVAESFTVLNAIRWRKPPYSTKAEMFDKDTMRRFFPASETIVFAEQMGADRGAMNEAGYEQASASLHCKVFGRVFGDYLRAEFQRANVTSKAIAALFPSASGGLTGCVSNWLLGYNCPTPAQYAAIRAFLGGEFLAKEYEALRVEYEALRRPFTVSADVPYTDVWDFPTVANYPGKHICEKPESMAEHIVNASSRPGDVVLDCFSGSGTFSAVAVRLGRRALACDMDPHWAERTRLRCEMAAATGRTEVRKIVKADPKQQDLFGAA